MFSPVRGLWILVYMVQSYSRGQ